MQRGRGAMNMSTENGLFEWNPAWKVIVISQSERETRLVLFFWETNQSRLLDGNWVYVIIGEVTHGEPWLPAAASLPFPRHLTGGQEERCFLAATVETHHSHGVLLVKIQDQDVQLGLWSYTTVGIPLTQKWLQKIVINSEQGPCFFNALGVQEIPEHHMIGDGICERCAL